MTIDKLYKIISDRQLKMPEKSYIVSLFKAGQDRIIQKVGEEAMELMIAAKNTNQERIIEESCDLIFHLLILLADKKITVVQIKNELEKRSRKL